MEAATVLLVENDVLVRQPLAPACENLVNVRYQGYSGNIYFRRLFLMSHRSSISKGIRQRTLCECEWSLLLDGRFRTNLSFVPDRLACESRKFWDRSRKLGWPVVFQLPPKAPTRLRFPSA